MNSISWLHFTDLHAGIKDQDWLWPACRDAFIDDLTRMHKIVGGFDLIIFTGDLAYKGCREDYEKAERILIQIVDHLEQLGSSPFLFTVPGNHDMKRPDKRNGTVRALLHWCIDDELRGLFWDDKHEEYDYKQCVTKAFLCYTDFCEKWNYEHELLKKNNIKYEYGELPGDFFATFKKKGFLLGLAGFNSAFLQMDSRNFKEKIEVHPQQFNTTIMKCDLSEWIKIHHANLLITHHPSDWFYSDAFKTFQKNINAPGRFIAHLHGHNHDSKHYSEKMGSAEARRIVQGISLFGSKSLNNGKELRIHGYNAGQIQIEDNKGSLKIWPRRLYNTNWNSFTVGPDQTLPLEDDCYVEEFKPIRSLDVNDKAVETSNSKIQKRNIELSKERKNCYGYEYDFFLSYVDVKEYGEWFHDNIKGPLMTFLEHEIGRRPEVYFAPHRVPGILNRHKKALSISCCLIPILLPDYFDTNPEWANYEFAVMKSRTSKIQCQLIKPVVLMGASNFSDFLQNTHYFDCYDYYFPGGGPAFRRTEKYIEFQEKLKKWVKEIVVDAWKSAPPWNKNFVDNFTDSKGMEVNNAIKLPSIG